jgi:hypothetical protein
MLMVDMLQTIGVGQCLVFGMGASNFAGNTKKATAASAVLTLLLCG